MYPLQLLDVLLCVSIELLFVLVVGGFCCLCSLLLLFVFVVDAGGGGVNVGVSVLCWIC